MAEDKQNNDFDENISYKIPFSERVGRNSLFNLAGNIISYILKFISIPIILNFIKFDFGYYYTITSYAGIIILSYNFFNLGTNFSSSKFISEYFSLKNENKINSVFSINLFLNILASIITTIILIFIMFFFVPSRGIIEPSFMNIYISSCVALIIGRFILNLVNPYTIVLLGFQRNDFYVFIMTIVNITTSFFKIIFIVLGFNVLGLIISDYLFIIIGSIVIFYIIKKRYKNLKFSLKYVNWKDIKRYSSQGLAFYFANFDETLFIDLNTVLIPYLMSMKYPYTNPNYSITIYGTSLKLGRYGMALTSSLQGGQVAIATELYTKKEMQKFRDLFGRLFNLSFFLSIVLATSVMLLSPQILLHYIGLPFYNAWPILSSLVLMYAIKLSIGLCRYIMQSMNLTHKWMYLAFLEYGLIVSFSLVGFIFFDLNGLAMGVALAVSIYSFIFLFYTANKLQYPIKSLITKFGKILFSISVPSTLFLFLKFFNLIPYTTTEGFLYLLVDGLIILIYAGISFLIFYLIKGFHKNDMGALKRSIKSIFKSIRRRTLIFNKLSTRKSDNELKE
ncbi:MAG: oligosaccharide flippase family protein [Candidatus Helarchaeota archaeon]